MVMDACNQVAFSSDGQRWEIDILVHKVLQGVCFSQSPFYFIFISFISNHMCGFCVAFWQ
jgi:hypothetical protein